MDFSENRAWFDRCVFPSRSSDVEPIKYGANYTNLSKIYEDLKINCATKTHSGRVVGITEMDVAGCTEGQIGRLSQHGLSVISKHYAKGFPMKAIFAANGFDKDSTRVSLPRDIKVPKELRERVFPWLDKVTKERSKDPNTARSTMNYLKLLDYFRDVIIQVSLTYVKSNQSHPII
jgi:hypothetical protein